MTDLLAVENVTKTFGALRAVDGVSLSVGEGEVLGIAGPNGSGKSTLFNAISGIPFHPDSGRISFAGEPIERLPAYRIAQRGVARTFQTETDFESLSVLDNVLIGMISRNHPGDHASRVRRAEELLAYVGLAADPARPAGELSVFDRKCLMLATALSLEPRLLLLDEPASGLARPDVLKTTELIRKINASGITVILIEHVVSLLLSVSRRLIVLNFGRVLAEGEPAAVVRDPRVVEAYLGSDGTHGRSAA